VVVEEEFCTHPPSRTGGTPCLSFDPFDGKVTSVIGPLLVANRAGGSQDHFFLKTQRRLASGWVEKEVESVSDAHDKNVSVHEGVNRAAFAVIHG